MYQQGLQFEDRSDSFKNTSVMCNIEVFISDAPDADGKEEEWLCVSGETFFARDIGKLPPPPPVCSRLELGQVGFSHHNSVKSHDFFSIVLDLVRI